MIEAKALLEAELMRALSSLANYDPGSQEYARCLDSARALKWWLTDPLYMSGESSEANTGDVADAPVAEAATTLSTETPSLSESGSYFNVEEYKSNLRVRLANARTNHNADTKAWLNEVGAAKFSAITDPCKLMKLNELVSEFEKEHP